MVGSEGADLRLLSVTKRFGDFTAVDDLTLEIPSGSFFALLGPSGCGKTTTLRMVAGLEHPTSGRVLLGEQDITRTRAHERPVNTVFQSYALFPHLSVLDNVAFGLVRRKVPDARDRARSALDLVELGHLATRRPAQLSGGQQQRVALARAVVNNPAVLLLDEPLGALDLKLRRQMQVELKRIQGEVGLTFVHVTHDQEEAMTMADTVAVMNQGRIEQLGPPRELYDLPRTTFVANFLGRSNLMPGTVAEDLGGVLGVEVDGRRVLVPVERVSGSPRVGSAVIVGVRPEKVLVVTDVHDLPREVNLVGPGTVLDVSYTGVSTEYLVEVPGLGRSTVFTQNLDTGPTAGEGAQVHLAWQPRHTFALPADEGTVTAGAELEAHRSTT